MTDIRRIRKDLSQKPKVSLKKISRNPKVWRSVSGAAEHVFSNRDNIVPKGAKIDSCQGLGWGLRCHMVYGFLKGHST